MKYLIRNRRMRTLLILCAAATAAASGVCLIFSSVCALICLVLGVLLTALFIRSQCALYRELSELSDLTGRILNGSAEARFGDFEEGELSVLNTGIRKLATTLRDNAQSLRAEKIRLSDAIADISHQIRTPLTSMELTLSLLSSGSASPERRRELLYDLRRQLSRIDYLVESLLKMSRFDAGTVVMKRETVSLKKLCEEALNPILAALDIRGVAVSESVPDVSFEGDLRWSAEALGNILKNCMEHTPEGGEIRVSGEETPLFVSVCVSDTGSGISKEDLPHIFERFYRGSGASDSSVGIGLALARTIVSAQDGTLTADNGPEGGARFEMRFYKSVV